MVNEMKNEVKNEMKSEITGESKIVTNTTEPEIEVKTATEETGDIIIEGTDIVRTFKM